MPTYQYKCNNCDCYFEEFQKITDEALKTCPKCGKDSLERLISASAFHLKGSGWYKTDYTKSGSAGTATSKTSDSTKSSDSTTTKKACSKNTCSC